MADLGDELEFKQGGIIQTRAKTVLENAVTLLGEIEKLGLFGTLEQGIFADIRRMRDGGKGLAGVVKKEQGYFNPFIEMMKGAVKP